MRKVLELRQGRAWLRFAPWLGGRVTQCALEDARGVAMPVLHPYPQSHADLLHWAKGGIYPLIPYSGRIDQARLHAGTRTIQLPAHPDALPHTLHGTAHLAPWTLSDIGDSAATMRLAHTADPGWPWNYEAEIRLSLQARALSVDLCLTNTDAQPMPAGIGLHPYLAPPDDVQLQFTAAAVWPPTPDLLAERPSAVAGDDDFSTMTPVGHGARTQFYGQWSGRMQLACAGQAWLEIGATDGLDHLVLHQPEGAPYLCLEPVSHVADAFNLAHRGVIGTGARILEPGASMRAGVAFRSVAAGGRSTGKET